jgi:hypothetical protein
MSFPWKTGIQQKYHSGFLCLAEDDTILDSLEQTFIIGKVMSTKLIKLACSASSFLKWFKISLGIIVIFAFFLPWASQIQGCSDSAVVVRENISGFSFVIENNAPEAATAPIIAIVIALISFLIIGKKHPLLRSLVSLVEAANVYFFAVLMAMEIFFLSFYTERYGFDITMVSLVGISIASLAEVAIHFPLLNKGGKTIIAIIVVLLILILTIMSLT